MSTRTSTDFGGAAIGVPDTREGARAVAGLWWLWLVTGAAWLIAGLVVLQFDKASVTTVGVIVGCMFLFAGVQQAANAALATSMRWLWSLFAALYLFAGLICLFNPEDTFAGLADILGFLFLIVGAWWLIEGFLTRDVNPVWWLSLISGPLMIVTAFWTSGQFFIEKAYVLLVFAGVWALLHGITDVVKAFTVRSLRDAL